MVRAMLDNKCDNMTITHASIETLVLTIMKNSNST